MCKRSSRPSCHKLQIGTRVTSAWAPAQTRSIAAKPRLKIPSHYRTVQGADMVFVTRVWAEARAPELRPCRYSGQRLDALTVAVVTKPFSF